MLVPTQPQVIRSRADLVLRIMEAYSSGDYTAVPSGTYGGNSYSPSYTSAIDKSYKVAKQRKAKQKYAASHGGSMAGYGGKDTDAKETILLPVAPRVGTVCSREGGIRCRAFQVSRT